MRASILFVRLYVFICLFTFISSRKNAHPVRLPIGKFECGVELVSGYMPGDLKANTRAANAFLKDHNLPITDHYKNLLWL